LPSSRVTVANKVIKYRTHNIQEKYDQDPECFLGILQAGVFDALNEHIQPENGGEHQ
jgi:hypothetical protein